MNFRQVIDTYGSVFPSKDIAHTLYYAQQGKQWAINRMRGLKPDGSFDKFKNSVYKPYAFLIDAPFKISDKCCVIMKERPVLSFEKQSGRRPFIALIAQESLRRQTSYIKSGCNSFNTLRPSSRPIMFWTEQDILRYILRYNLKIPAVYGNIINICGTLSTTKEKRTGCMFCLIGTQFETVSNKFCRMKLSHPAQYHYCMDVLGMLKILDFLHFPH